MDLLKTVLLSCAVLAPAAAEGRDLSQHTRSLPLIRYTTPPANIESAQVLNERGTMVGSVQSIEMDAAGRPAAISVRPSDGRPLMVVGAGAASYDRERNVVITAAVQPLGIASTE